MTTLYLTLIKNEEIIEKEVTQVEKLLANTDIAVQMVETKLRLVMFCLSQFCLISPFPNIVFFFNPRSQAER